MGSQTGTDSDGSRASDQKDRGARGRDDKGTGGTRAGRGTSCASDSSGTRARRGASSEPNDSSGTRETSGASGMNQKKESRVGKGATPTAVQSAKTAFGQNTVAAAVGAVNDGAGSSEWREVPPKRKIKPPLKFVQKKKNSPPADESLVQAEVERVVPTFDAHRHQDNTVVVGAYDGAESALRAVIKRLGMNSDMCTVRRGNRGPVFLQWRNHEQARGFLTRVVRSPEIWQKLDGFKRGKTFVDWCRKFPHSRPLNRPPRESKFDRESNRHYGRGGYQPRFDGFDSRGRGYHSDDRFGEFYGGCYDPPSLAPGMGPPGMGGSPEVPLTRASYSGGGGEEQLCNMSTQQIKDFLQKKEALEAEAQEAKLKEAKIRLDTKMSEAESARVDYERVLGAQQPAPAPAMARVLSPICIPKPTPVLTHGFEPVHSTDAEASGSGRTAREKGKGAWFPSREAVEQATRRQEEAEKATREREAQARRHEEQSKQMASDLQQMEDTLRRKAEEYYAHQQLTANHLSESEAVKGQEAVARLGVSRAKETANREREEREARKEREAAERAVRDLEVRREAERAETLRLVQQRAQQAASNLAKVRAAAAAQVAAAEAVNKLDYGV